MGPAPPSHEPACPHRPGQRRAGLSGSRPSRDWRPSRGGSPAGGAERPGFGQRAGVVCLGAAVLHVAEVGLLGDGAGLGRGCPSWSQRARARPRPRPWPGGSPCRCPRAADLVLPMHSRSGSHSSRCRHTGGRCRDTPGRCHAAVPCSTRHQPPAPAGDRGRTREVATHGVATVRARLALLSTRLCLQRSPTRRRASAALPGGALCRQQTSPGLNTNLWITNL
jgi:hypothetical protein